MGANTSTEYDALGSAMNKGLVIPSNGSSADNGRIIVSNGSSADKGRVIAFHSSSKWKMHFEASKLTSNLMVIDFTASCIQMLSSFKIDVDELEDVAQEFGVHVLPTFMLIKKGKEVDKLVGANKDELRKKIEKHMA
ncbi:thioredoxin H2-like [Olea europaea subsp. europaea]|uniref:Thioredoxin H2-like n=1 Tax=Olea europaea subsp. europaea TaxID=158383 RepID=A0A8S0SIS7_OLEEU|nr:thioredoxin H2-like [Olea europaea subsp. europaea]